MLFPLHFDAQGNRLDNATGSGSYVWFVSADTTLDPVGTQVSSEDRYTVSDSDAGQHIRVQGSFPLRAGSIDSGWVVVGSVGNSSSLSGRTITLTSTSGNPDTPRRDDTLRADITGIASSQVQWLWFIGTTQVGIGPSYTIRASDQGIPRVIAVSDVYSGFAEAQTRNAIQQGGQQLFMGSIAVENRTNVGEIVNIRIGDELAVIHTPDNRTPVSDLGSMRVRWISGTEVVHSAQDSTTFTVRQDDKSRALMVHVWFDATDQRFPLSTQAGFVGDGGSLVPMGGSVALVSSGDRDNPKVGDTLTATLNNSNVPSSVQIVWSWEHESSQAIRGGSSSYTVQHGDLGMRVRAVPHAVGFNNYGVSALTVNAVTRYDLAGSIVIENTTRPNQTPRVNDVVRVRYIPDTGANSASNGSGERFIRWSSGGIAVSGRDNDESFLLGPSDVGNTMSVRLWFSDQNESSAKTVSIGPVGGDVPHLLPLGGTVTITSSANLGSPRIGDTLTATLTNQHPDAVGLPIVWQWRHETIIRSNARSTTGPTSRTINSADYVIWPSDIDHKLVAIPNVAGFDNAGVSAVIPNTIGRNPVPPGTVIVDNLQTGMNDIVRQETPLVGHILRARYIRSGPFDLHPMEDPPEFTWWGQPPTPVGGVTPPPIELGKGDAYTIKQTDWDRGVRITVEVEFATRAGVVRSREVRMPPVFVFNDIASNVFNGIGVDGRAMAAAYGNGIFLLGSVGGRIAVSTDNGETWTGVPVGLGASQTGFLATEEINVITFGNGLFIATGGASATGGRINRSVNGLTWTQVPAGTATGTTTTFGTLATYANAYGNGIYVAGGSTNRMAWSPAGASNWTEILPGTSTGQSGLENSAAPTGPIVVTIHHTGTAFIAGANGGRMSRSTDGRNWTQIPAGTGGGQNTFPTTGDINYIWGIASVNNPINAPANSRFVIATSINGRMARSVDDGLNWTAIPAGTMANSGQSGVASTVGVRRVIYTNGIFIAGAANGSMSWSVDNGVNWIPIPEGTNPGQSNFTTNVYNFASNDADGWIVAIGTGGRVAMAHWPQWD